MISPLHIGVLVEARYLVQSQPSGMIRALKAEGHRVEVIDPQTDAYVLGDDRWLEGFDVALGRGRSNALLCLLAWAESFGIPVINREAAIASVYDKAEMSVILARGRIQTPRTFFGSIASLARQVSEGFYPLILKPIFGDNSQGLLVVSSPEEMAGIEWRDPVALAQSYLPTDGYDVKLYGIGNEVWVVRKPSPFNKPVEPITGKSEAELLPLTPELEALGRRCGQLFDLELYGVDCILTEEGPLVIEINEFPNYTGVPEADRRLAEYVTERARQEQSK